MEVGLVVFSAPSGGLKSGPAQLTATSVDLNTAAQADRCRHACIAQNLCKTLGVGVACGLILAVGDGVERGEIDVAEQSFAFVCQFMGQFRVIIDAGHQRILNQ